MKTFGVYTAWFRNGTLIIYAENRDHAILIINGAIEYSKKIQLINNTSQNTEKYMEKLYPNEIIIRNERILISNVLQNTIFDVDLLKDYSTRFIYNGFTYSSTPSIYLET